MELLYIWIEDYKNIHRQGFNFSPKYRFEFTPTTDENNEVTGGELTCKETDFPDNFFGEGISNVTAIVGENGSGKSTLLEFMQRELDNIHTKQTYLRIYKQKENVIIYYLEDWMLSNHTNIQDLQLRKYKIIQNNKSTNIVRGAGFDFEDFTHRVKFAAFFDGNNDYIQGRNKSNISTNALLKDHIDKDDKKHLNYKLKELYHQINFVKQYNNTNIPFHLPNTLSMYIETISLFFTEKTITELQNRGIEEIIFNITVLGNKQKRENSNELFAINLYNSFFNSSIWFFIQKNLDTTILKDFSFNKKDDFITVVKKVLEILFEKAVKKEIYNNINTFIQELLSKPDNEIVKEDEIYLKFDSIHQLLFLYNQIYFVNPYLSFTWREYSYGELVLLNTFSRFYSIKDEIKKNNLLIFIDEGELGLHPQWQKEYLKNLIDVLPEIFSYEENGEKKYKQIQIILTSHSPFLVSDLPKENIIFLRKGQEEDKELKDKCIVVKEGDRKHPQVTQTFGQNIHTLFADSFFMEGGLMGEFAKEKIKNVLIDITNNQQDTRKDENRKIEIEFIISQIGEPLLRKKLERIYQQNIDANTFKSLSELEEEENQLKQRLAEIAKLKNNKK